MSIRSQTPGLRRGTSVPSQLPEAMEAGVKLKMPVGLLGHVTRAQKTLEDLRSTGGVEHVVVAAIRKFEQEVIRLREACALVHPVGLEQQLAKEAWLERNLVPKERFLLAMLSIVDDESQPQQLDASHPQLQVNGLQINNEEGDEKSVASVPRSRTSVGSSASRLARAEALAQTRMLEAEKAHRKQKRLLEEQERQLRLQREDAEIENQLLQAKIRQETLEEAQSHPPSEVGSQAPCKTAMDVLSEFQRPNEESRGHPSRPAEVNIWPRSVGHKPQPPPRPLATEGLLQNMLLPQSTLPTFKGDHMEFLWFLKAFEMRVEAVTADPARRLHLLIQHLEGDARTLVLGCQLALDPAVGYERAKNKLVSKYGNPVRQSLAFKSKLMAWPSVRKDSAVELEKFSVQLQLCEEVMLIGGLGELNAAGTLVHLMRKLPQKMQESWQVKACRIEATQMREVNFADFSTFVAQLAAARNHPVFGYAANPAGDAKTLLINAEEDHRAGRATTTVTSSQSTTTTAVLPSSSDLPKTTCALCSGNHGTVKCRKAANMPLEERKTKLKGLCFACLRPGHNARQCTERLTCEKCKGQHPLVLHEYEKDTEARPGHQKGANAQQGEGGQPAPQNGSKESLNKPNGETACAVSSSSTVAVAVVPVRVWCEQRKSSVVVKAILDPGSTASFISHKLMSMLSLQPQKASLQLTTLTESSVKMQTHSISGLKVTGMDQNDVVALPPVYTVQTMPFVCGDMALEDDVQAWPHLDEVPFAWQPEATVEMLIGMNAPMALQPLEIIGGEPGEPYAVRTALGWCVNGPLKRSSATHTAISNRISAQEVQDGLNALYYQEFKDAYDFRSKGCSQDDSEWVNKVKASICKAEDSSSGQFQIELPFKDDAPPVVDNRKQAEQRLSSLKRKLLHNEQFRRDYAAFMQKMEDNEFVEELEDEEASRSTAWTMYIPHHGVYHPRKPGKIRVVFNCSNKFNNVSLNDRLLQGPDLTNSLLGVLLRFRQEHVAFMADIESMFYRVRVPREQRDCLRYLWWPKARLEGPVKTYRMAVHVFGATSSPSCANYALRRAAQNAKETGLVEEDVQRAVERNFYVDDCLKSMPDVPTAIRMAKGLRDACGVGGFRLTKFVSSSVDVLRALPASELSKGLTQVDLQDDKCDPLGSLQERALGVAWDVSRDSLKVTVNVADQTQSRRTKRTVLSVLSSVYDPLGMAAPVLILARVLFRNLTKEKDLGWDDELELQSDSWQLWTRWVASLNVLHGLAVARCFRPTGPDRDDWQLHVFCDASEAAYAAVVYLRQKRKDAQEAHVVFVAGKARVTPPKVVTIPRLELVAAKLATDMAQQVGKELEYPLLQRHFWSDSQTVLKYLSNRVRCFHTFVANRVATILEATKLEEWRYVPSDLNPADEGSRGCMPSDFHNGNWLRGPDFLREMESTWPRQAPLPPMQEDDPEVHTLLITGQHTDDQPFIEQLAARYSTAAAFRVAVGVWCCFLDYCKGKTLKIDTVQAELQAIRSVQRHAFPRELEALQAGGAVAANSALYRLSPILNDEDVIVMESRTRSKLPILPGSSRMAQLLVWEAHSSHAHFGAQATAAAVSQRFWVIGVNRLTKRMLKTCPTCQRCFARPSQPRMAALPEYRLHAKYAFECTGVDYFGPFHASRGRSTIKLYGIIFSCATTRAVHLETAEDLSSSTFINALRRFVARRGHVSHMVSDNGTNFVGAEAELRKELQEELQTQQQSEAHVRWLRTKAIKWSFNPPEASHHGGFWERLIRSVRKAFASSALFNRGRPLTQDGVNTTMCEIEAVLNDRPLTSVSEDPQDFEALTPNHLLLGREGPAAPPGDFTSDVQPIRQQWKRVQHVANDFWRRWLLLYKTLLHRRFKWHGEKPSLQVEDVVLIMDSTQPREYWKVGRVVEVHTGADGRVRVATVRTAKSIMKKPVSKLCWLEATTDAWLEARKLRDAKSLASHPGEDVTPDGDGQLEL